jgi:hypothetical protein
VHSSLLPPSFLAEKEGNTPLCESLVLGAWKVMSGRRHAFRHQLRWQQHTCTHTHIHKTTTCSPARRHVQTLTDTAADMYKPEPTHAMPQICSRAMQISRVTCYAQALCWTMGTRQ